MAAASTSSIPMVVHKDDVTKAVAMDGGILFMGQAIGSTAAGGFIMLVGGNRSILCHVAVYGMATLCLLGIKSSLHVEHSIAEIQRKQSMWKEIKEGFIILRKK